MNLISSIYGPELSDQAIFQKLGEYVKENRLLRNKTQEDVAKDAGIKRATLARLEKGEGGTTMATFVRVLRSLGLLQALETFTPPSPFSPLNLAKLEQNKKLRAAKKKRPARNTKPSEW